jgi:hypothetical protein
VSDALERLEEALKEVSKTAANAEKILHSRPGVGAEVPARGSRSPMGDAPRRGVRPI